MSESHAVRLPDDATDKIEELADKHDTTKSNILRHIVDNGLRAHKYYQEFEIAPENKCNANSEQPDTSNQ